jgi:energy-coupling factor transporter ATP-binding protein EcfA2
MKKQQINLVISNKGGCGKSTLFYLFALANKHNQNALFVDCDFQTETSTRQVAPFLEPSQFQTLKLVDERNVLQRDKIIGFWESLIDTPSIESFMDFGSAESEGLLHLIEDDLPFVEFANAVNQEFVFNVVVAGGAAYKACVNYLVKLHSILKSRFKIVAYANLTSFSQFPELHKELHNNIKKMSNTEIVDWGDIQPSTFIGTQILDNIRRGGDLSNLSIGPKLKLIRELKTNFNYEQEDSI